MGHPELAQGTAWALVPISPMQSIFTLYFLLGSTRYSKMLRDLCLEGCPKVRPQYQENGLRADHTSCTVLFLSRKIGPPHSPDMSILANLRIFAYIDRNSTKYRLAAMLTALVFYLSFIPANFSELIYFIIQKK